MDPDGVVRHREIRSPEDLPAIARTKYVQSDLAAVWEGLRDPAARGRPVLFCGTPCQADAVRVRLGEDRGGWILADLICYGVPSPGIWRRYGAWLERRYRGPLHSFSFRDKRNRDSGPDRGEGAGLAPGQGPLLQVLLQPREPAALLLPLPVLHPGQEQRSHSGGFLGDRDGPARV